MGTLPQSILDKGSESAKTKGGLRPLSFKLLPPQAAFGGQSKFGRDFSEAWRSASE
jgi:hypothetical protein